MAPKKIPPLSSLQPRKEGAAIPVTPGSSAFPPSSFRPKTICLVLEGGSSIDSVNKSVQTWAQNGFGKKVGGSKAPIDQAGEHEQKAKEGDVTARLSALVLELPKGENTDSLSKIEAATKAPHNLPVTCVHRISSAELPTPAPAPESVSLAYRVALPNLSTSLKSSMDTWLSLLSDASKHDYVIELDLAGSSVIESGEEAGLEARREEVEELLGRSYEREVNAKGGADEAGSELPTEENPTGKVDEGKGVKIILDNLGGPPNVPSSHLLRSTSLDNWNAFISRLALHPRIYLKLSPMSFPSGLPTATGSGSGALASAASAVASAASSVASSVGIGASYVERRTELRRRLRTILSLAYEAFGEDRIIFTTSLDGCGVKPTKGSAQDGVPQRGKAIEVVGQGEEGEGGSAATEKSATDSAAEAEQLSAAEEWYELCRETFQQIGLGDQSLDKIFNDNALKVYRI